jgi:hypothetical protein
MFNIQPRVEMLVAVIVLLYMIREVYFPDFMHKKVKPEPLPVDWKHEFKLGPHIAELSDAEYWAAWEEATQKELK